MDERIKDLCEKIEKAYDVKILFCVESGSRVWGMSSEDSDYDVRFVFKRDIKEYINLLNKDEVIKETYDNMFRKCKPKGCYIDLVGFDIFKFLKLFIKSNPTTIEWILSNKLYYGEIPKVFINFIIKNLNRIAMYHHYKSMCKQNYLKYLKSGALVTYKKYLYAMRGLVYAEWVACEDTLPPINFKEAIEKSYFLDTNIKNKLLKIIELKKSGKEKDIVENDIKIDRYIETFLQKDYSQYLGKRQLPDITELNEELWKQLGLK